MDTITTTNLLQHDDDALTPDREPSFADVVYLLTTPPHNTDLSKTWDLGYRISRYVALFAYSLVHPQQLAMWVNNTCKISETIEDATYAEVLREWAYAAKSKALFAFCVAQLFLFAPRAPEKMGESIFGVVRIKCYPDLDARKRWPASIGKLLEDVPVDSDGSVELKIVMNRWGMQNCYAIDANRTRPHLWRRPVERLNPLAIDVLLADGHKVIGAVGPSLSPSRPSLK